MIMEANTSKDRGEIIQSTVEPLPEGLGVGAKTTYGVEMPTKGGNVDRIVDAQDCYGSLIRLQ
jgi:hypothetical protein